MRARRWAWSSALVLVLVLLPAGCLPIPRAQVPFELPPLTLRMPLGAVSSDAFTVAGANEPHTPDSLNRSTVVRLRADEPVRAVLVLVPGLFGGAGSLEILGRQLVASTPGLQVWLLDRRSNALEDHSGFRAAERAGDPRVALRTYLGADGQPPSYRPPPTETIRFMAYWGLRVHLEDLAAVIDRARRAAPRVYLGGHSLGASLVALYAAYRRSDGRVGGDIIAGLVLLDGAPGRTGAFGLPDAVDGRRVAGMTVVPSLAEVEAGRAAPYLAPGLAPPWMLRNAVVATYARLRPDALAPAELADFRVTNLALFGIRSDDSYAELPSFAPALGEATDARASGFLLPFLLEGGMAARSRTIVGVAAGADHVGWSPGRPPEATDLASYLQTVTGPYADRAEWYFPVRLLIDLSALRVDLVGADDFVPMASVTVPTLAVGAGRGMLRSTEGFSAYVHARAGARVTTVVVPGVTHIDLVTARAGPAATLFRRWSGL